MTWSVVIRGNGEKARGKRQFDSSLSFKSPTWQDRSFQPVITRSRLQLQPLKLGAQKPSPDIIGSLNAHTSSLAYDAFSHALGIHVLKYLSSGETESPTVQIPLQN